MTANGNFLYNSLSTSLKYDTWLLGASSFTILYQLIAIWPMTAMGHVLLPFLIKIIEIRHLTARGNFPYNSSSTSFKYDQWLLWVISFTIPYQHHWNMTYDFYNDFLYNSLSKSLKDDLWLLGAISFTIPYQMIEIWPMTARGHFLYYRLYTI